MPSIGKNRSDITSEEIMESDEIKKKKKSKKTDAAVDETDETNGYQQSEEKVKKTKKRKLESSDNEAEESMKKKEKKEKRKCKESSPEVEKSEAEVLGDFSNFRISDSTKTRLTETGIKYLFPIQTNTFDHIYDGYDVIGKARTGTGKTLSFVLPVAERLVKDNSLSFKRGRAPTVLVLAPTRELAKQVNTQFDNLYKRMSVYCIYGGVPYEPQESAIRSGLDILVGTPGRIMDHMNKGLDLSQLKHVILDEVDRMLDMGFAESVEEILAASYKTEREEKPQTLFFSATLPAWVQKTARKYMTTERKVVDLVGNEKLKTSTTVEHLAIRCPYFERASTLGDVVQVYCGQHGRTMIFTETKKEANELCLNSVMKQETQVLHGDIPQKQREITLTGFREGKFRCLVATDVAARGLDIPEVDLVVQCEPPKDVDAYIHRSGRTGRAGRQGVCIVFYKPTQDYMLPLVERKAGIKFRRVGAPQPTDIIKASAHDARRSLEQIPEEVLEHFRASARFLIEEKGAEDALAAALAQISGTTEIKARSLLSAQEGFTTYIMRQEMIEMRSVGYMWRIIDSNLPPEIRPEIKGMTMLADMKGVAFDLPSTMAKLIKDNWTDQKGVTLEVASELPELQERVDTRSNGFSGQQRFGNQRQNNFNRNGSYNNNNRSNSWGRNQNGGGSFQTRNGFVKRDRN